MHQPGNTLSSPDEALSAPAQPADGGSGEVSATTDGRTAEPDAAAMIAVDAMGGDHAPAEIVAGAIAASRELRVRIALAGRPGQIRPLLARLPSAADVYIEPAEDSVAMNEGALASWRRPRSSIAVACQLVRRGYAGAVVSAGSTGAVVTTAQLRLRQLPGVARPALAVALPTRPTPTVLIDAGAIADPKPEMLVQFAQLGVAYAEVAFGIAEPRVGLLTIGSEPGKGNKLARKGYELLDADPTHGGIPISFAGNVEGGDLLSGRVDVIVTDGFTGNVALKTLEGTAGFAAAQLRDVLGGSRAARLGALLQRRAIRELSDRFDPETYGGAALLGLEATVVIAHGAVTARGATAACALAARLIDKRITERIRERLGPSRGAHFLRRSDRVGGATSVAARPAAPE
ncbi:MAG: phosphate acyltransferase PlsX [Actinobacteria bacterium]|nr:phosphate acyltransferase PlsX [Actinomycetota bacterium]